MHWTEYRYTNVYIENDISKISEYFLPFLSSTSEHPAEEIQHTKLYVSMGHKGVQNVIRYINDGETVDLITFL